jgi:hypothetical protein
MSERFLILPSAFTTRISVSDTPVGTPLKFNTLELTVVVTTLFVNKLPLTPTPPLTVNAPVVVDVELVVFVIDIGLDVTEPTSVTSCKSNTGGGGSNVGSD